jgi:DNA replication protein DnaC
MKEVINLVKKGETRQALERLLNLVKVEHKQEVTLLLANYNAHERGVMEGTQKKDATLIPRTNKAIIAICNEYAPSAKPKTFAEPPILDNLPLDKDGYLLGRKAALEQLHTSLQSKNILTLVNGMGGIGKSTLASFYANFPTYKAAYSHCYWVSVSDLTGEVKEALINAFAEGLALYQMPKEAQLAKIQTYLSGLQGKTLLILDNANDKKKVTEAFDFLRKCKIKVLFTSRANMTNIPAQALEKLLPKDAFALFTHYFPAAAVMPETPQLLKNIDYHTLLTEFMAKSLAHNPVLSLQDLVEITQQQNFTDELLAYTQFTSYHTHTYENADAEIQPAEYLLQIFPIQNLSKQEQAILRYFAILPTEWIEMPSVTKKKIQLA